MSKGTERASSSLNLKVNPVVPLAFHSHKTEQALQSGIFTRALEWGLNQRQQGSGEISVFNSPLSHKRSLSTECHQATVTALTKIIKNLR